MNNKWKYYQPNKKDIKDEVGDCAIRAFTKALNKSWLEVFDDLIYYAREHQCLLNQKPAYQDYLINEGWHYQSNGKISKTKTVLKFCKLHNQGTYILYIKVGYRTHLVTVADGIYYDTWDCGNYCVYGYWVKGGIEIDK